MMDAKAGAVVKSELLRRWVVMGALASLVAFVTSGCGLLVMGVVAGGTPPAHRLQLAGAKFPAALFEAAAIDAGGVLTVNTAEYMRAELREVAVSLELQQVRPGHYQLIGDSLRTRGLPRWPTFGSKVHEVTRQVADRLVVGGYRIVDGELAKGP